MPVIENLFRPLPGVLGDGGLRPEYEAALRMGAPFLLGLRIPEVRDRSQFRAYLLHRDPILGSPGVLKYRIAQPLALRPFERLHFPLYEVHLFHVTHDGKLAFARAAS